MKLIKVKRTYPALLDVMKIHYSQPKGFVGRNICYSINHEDNCFGFIVGGSATLHLIGRNEFFNNNFSLNQIINNIFYHIFPVVKYPFHNFTSKVISLWRNTIVNDWEEKYSDKVVGFETLVELPRTGNCYLQDGWSEVGTTKGYTCKRVSGKGTDNWSGKRVWNTKELRPKKVFCRLK